MTILLCGGGSLAEIDPIIDRFVQLAAEKPHRLALIASGSVDHVALRERLAQSIAIGFELVLAGGGQDEPVDGGELLGCDAIVIAGDDPQALLSALEHRIVDLRRLVHEGALYLGIDAGAAIASDVAWLGGNAIGEVMVAPGLEPVELEFGEGLGLVDVTVIPDAVGAGRIGLAGATVEAGFSDRVVAIDAGSALEIAPGRLALNGDGSMWQFELVDERVRFSSLGAVDAE